MPKKKTLLKNLREELNDSYRFMPNGGNYI